MLTLTDVKTALRIDSNIDDALLDMYMNAAESYLRDAITDYDALRAESANTEENSFNAKADVVQIAIVAEMYEHRNRDAQFSNIIRYMINQLQYTRVKENGES